MFRIRDDKIIVMRKEVRKSEKDFNFYVGIGASTEL